MQVFLNEFCLSTQDLYKLEGYIDILKTKNIKRFFYAKGIEKYIAEGITDENELNIWLNSFDRIQNFAQPCQGVYENNISYLIPLFSQKTLFEVQNHSSVYAAVQNSIGFPQEIIAILNLSDCELNQYGHCTIIRQDDEKKLIELLKLPIIDSFHKIHLFIGLEFIKAIDKEYFVVLEKTKEYKESLQEAITFDFKKFTYPNNNLLPLKKFSNLMLPHKYKGWEDWGKEIKQNGKEAVNAANFEYGIKVATINGYIFSKVTEYNETKNSKREIYEVGEGRNKKFLSIEFEKPFVFEAFNFDGSHIGELSFEGNLKPQNKHNIKVNR